MKRTFILFLVLVFSATLFAQKKTTTSAVISFDASTAIDELPKAVNKTAIGALDKKLCIHQSFYPEPFQWYEVDELG
jgi:hypothetical protein